jgi:hypothetical protein
MSYSDEWLKAVRAKRTNQESRTVEPVPVVSTTWKPWAEMTAEESRKALAKRDTP